VDANRLLKAMDLPQMSGNYHAMKFLTSLDASTGSRPTGYATHFVTTGISSTLYVMC
jgi:hypothetical protein